MDSSQQPPASHSSGEPAGNWLIGELSEFDGSAERFLQLIRGALEGGVTGKEIAEAAGVDASSVSRWKSGKSAPSDERDRRLKIEMVRALVRDLQNRNAPGLGRSTAVVGRPGPRFVVGLDVHGIVFDYKAGKRDYFAEVAKLPYPDPEFGRTEIIEHLRGTEQRFKGLSYRQACDLYFEFLKGFFGSEAYYDERLELVSGIRAFVDQAPLSWRFVLTANYRCSTDAKIREALKLHGLHRLSSALILVGDDDRRAENLHAADVDVYVDDKPDLLTTIGAVGIQTIHLHGRNQPFKAADFRAAGWSEAGAQIARVAAAGGSRRYNSAA